MRGLSDDMVAHVRVWSRGQAGDVVCAAVCPGVPVTWLRSADVLVIAVDRPEPADAAKELFARFPGCSVVVVTGFAGAPHLVHVRAGGPSPHISTGDPWLLGALAHARSALGTEPAGCGEETGAAPVTARVPADG